MTQPTIIAEDKAAAKFDSVERPAGDVASDVRKDLATMNARIDDIVAFQQRKGLWYRDTALLISEAAFFISLVTSGISAYRTYRQDINSREDALHSTIQQYYAASHNSSFITRNFSGSPEQITQIAIQTLAKRSLSIVDELGRNASAVDLVDAGMILANVNEFNSAEHLFTRAIDAAVNPGEYLGAVRALAQLQYYLGKRDDATVNIKKALDVFLKFPKEANSADYVNHTHAETYLYWAGFLEASDCKLLNENISQAAHYAGLLTPVVQQGFG